MHFLFTLSIIDCIFGVWCAVASTKREFLLGVITSLLMILLAAEFIIKFMIVTLGG
jgi:multisubunit Na+/H+ antiporter MnhE subunit